MYDFKNIIVSIFSIGSIESVQLVNIEIYVKIICQILIAGFSIYFLIYNNKRKDNK